MTEIDNSGSIIEINGAMSDQLNDSMSATFVTTTSGAEDAELTNSASESRVNRSSISHSMSSGDGASSYCFQNENIMQYVGVEHRGGPQNVHGTKTDFQNATRDVRHFIVDRDAQIIVDTLISRSVNLQNFSFEYKVVKSELRYIFWADDVSKCNYDAFGEVLGFDATFHTNKYGMIFVSFTGVDHHKKCVIFGDGLIYDETIESNKWLLDKFLKTHKKQPKLVLTDQDVAVKQVVRAVFDQSIHRLCMRHIVKKIPLKVDFNAHDTTVSSSCIGFTRVGYLCRHAFCVFRYSVVELIPDKYLPARWMRNVLPARIPDITNRYSAEDEDESVLRHNMFELLTDCADRLRHKPNCLNALFAQLKVIKDKVFKEFPSEPSCNSKRSIISELVGQPDTVDVTIKPPTGIKNKGSGTKLWVGVVEKLLENFKAAKESAAAAVLADIVVDRSTIDRSVNRYATHSNCAAST
ncbi:uncharacterized protein LOC143634720 [Bidens hawaiensis]|uniref:uncharacterized protein LOC143634720 n=1 Tax=Bidens hawaiensis TaxID=980011 RepID=UPI0040493BD5